MGGDSTSKPAPVLTENQKHIRAVISNITRTIELLSSTDFEDAKDSLPSAFKEIAKPLKLAKVAFNKYKDNPTVSESEKDATAIDKFKKSITMLSTRTKRLHTICGAVIPPDDDDKPPLDRYKTAVKNPDERVEILVKSVLQTGLKEIAKEPYITAAERKELKEALKKVEEIEPSLPNSNAAAGQHIYNNEADGTINVNHGNGNMNINPGSGQIFDGGEFQNLYFGVQPPAPRQ